MKRQGHRQRFYLWDYLWWQGEQWQQLRPVSRVDGSMVVFGYILALIIAPLIFLCNRLLHTSAIIQIVVWCPVVLAGHSWVERIYRQRGKAVLKHYAKRNFHPIVGIILFLLSTAIMFFLMYCYEYYIPKP